jgi:hypothetical protein
MNAYWMDGPETEAYVERTQTRALALLDKLKAAGVLE